MALACPSMPDRTRIALLGDRNTDYVTHRELDAALGLMPDWVDAGWLPTDSPSTRSLGGLDGVWIVSGSPYRDDDAVLAAIARAREEELPVLATCSGFQYALVEFARAIAGLDAAHAEMDPAAEAPLVEQLACSLVGERRMVTCVPGTRLAEICGTEPFSGFHWCGYGLADGYEQALAEAGLIPAAHAEDAGLEGFELRDHPFFFGTLFQPQVGSSDGGPLHPLIQAFLEAARAGVPAR
jgi:CTP synthase (UTP-ammonia lyase)